MGLLNDLFVRIKGDKSHLDGTLKSAGGSLQSFASKASGFIKAAFTVTAIVEFSKKVISASEDLSDKFSFAVAGAKGALHEFFKMIATANFGNFIGNLTEGFTKAKSLAEELDALADKNAYVEFLTGEKKVYAGVQEEIVKDKTGRFSLERRKAAAEDLKSLEKEIYKITASALQDTYNLEAKGWENKNKMTLEKGRELYETIASITKENQALLEDAWKKSESVIKGNGAAVESARLKYILNYGLAGNNVTPDQVRVYRQFMDLMKTGEEDVIPKLYGILQRYNEGVVAAQERYNGVLRITNALLSEQGQEIERIGVPKADTSNLKIPQLGGTPGAADVLAGGPKKPSSAYQEQWVQSWKDAVQEVTSLISDAFINLWESIGKGSFQGFGDQLLQNFGQFIANFGKMLVSMGTSMLLALTLMKTPSIPTAIAAIAAGAAAMAVGGVMMGMASRQSGNLNSSSGGGGGSTGMTAQQIKVIVEGRIRGKDIVIASRRYEEAN